MRSVRVSDDNRAIIVHPTKGDIYRLVWVDKHDDAYAWAEVRIFSESPDGSHATLAIEDMDELERRVQSSPAPVIPGNVFATFDDETLITVGVAPELLPLLRQIGTRDVLSLLSGLIAEHLLLALVSLLDGVPIGEIREMIAAEDAKRPAEMVEMLGPPQAPEDQGRIETVSLQHGLRELLELIMTTHDGTSGASTAEGKGTTHRGANGNH